MYDTWRLHVRSGDIKTHRCLVILFLVMTVSTKEIKIVNLCKITYDSTFDYYRGVSNLSTMREKLNLLVKQLHWMMI